MAEAATMIGSFEALTLSSFDEDSNESEPLGGAENDPAKDGCIGGGGGSDVIET